MSKKLKKIPSSYVIRQKSFNTEGTRDPKNGQMTGRKKVKGRGDSTGVIRIKKYFDRNGNGKRDSQDAYPGMIFGRTEPYPVRGSSKRRGSMRDI